MTGGAVVETIIADARRRARERRRRYLAALVASAAVGAVIYAVVDWATSSGASSRVAPPTVAHALIETRVGGRLRVIDLGTGAVRPARVTNEVWWNRKDGLARVVTRVDGRVQSDRSGQMCGIVRRPGGMRRECLPPSPFNLVEGHFAVRPTRPLRTGTFRGRKIVWARGFFGGEVGLDAKTRTPRIARALARNGTVLGEQVITISKPLPLSRAPSPLRVASRATRTTFSSLPPEPRARVEARAVSRSAAAGALDRPALWLGLRFAGHRLRRVEVGAARIHGRSPRKIRFVRLDYGVLVLKEFGREHPPSHLQGPRTGGAVLEGRWRAALVRDGVLVVMSRRYRLYRLTPARMVEVANALRPIPN